MANKRKNHWHIEIPILSAGNPQKSEIQLIIINNTHEILPCIWRYQHYHRNYLSACNGVINFIIKKI
jgi:hypothetical protein